jgi:NitT/TauT family transport system substrate-binding protein
MTGPDRRDILIAAASGVVALGTRRIAAQTALLPVRATYGPPGVLYAANMIGLELGFAREEGLDLKIVATDGGAKSRQVLAAGEVEFGHGDATHPLQLSNRGKTSKILYCTETIATYANVIVRRDLYDQGITTVEKFAEWKRPDGAKPIIAATAIGSGTWMFGTAIFEGIGAGPRVNWVGGGGTTTILGGLQTKQFDAIMATPAWQFQAEDHGWGKAIYDVRDKAAWDKAFGGAIPVATIYALDATIKGHDDFVQAYVNMIYRSMQWLKQAPVDEVFARIGTKYLGDNDPGALKREITYYQQIWNYGGEVTEAVYQRAGKVWYRDGTDLVEAPYPAAVDMRFRDNAAKKFG